MKKITENYIKGRVSVILPNFNHDQFLGQCITSIITQSHNDIELLVVDDGSTDKSAFLISEFSEFDPRIKPVYFEKNSGVLAAVSNAWSRVTGEFVYLSASDDYLSDKNFFTRAVNYLSQNTDHCLFFGMASTFSNDTQESLGRLGRAPQFGYHDGYTFLKNYLLGNLEVPGCSSVIRSSHLREIGGLPEDLGPLQDHFALHFLGSRYGAYAEDAVVAHVRLFPNSGSYSSSVTFRQSVLMWRIFEYRMREYGDLSKKFLFYWTIWRVKNFVKMFFNRNRIGVSLKKWIKIILFK